MPLMDWVIQFPGVLEVEVCVPLIRRKAPENVIDEGRFSRHCDFDQHKTVSI
jgi:hypothetical protein